MALIPVLAGRPPVIHVDGWVVYLSIRDVEYLRVKRIMRQAMLVWHPDKGVPFATTPRKPSRWHRTRRIRGRRTKPFRQAQRRLKVWLLQQRRAYWDLNETMPPDWKGDAKPPPGRVRKQNERRIA